MLSPAGHKRNSPPPALARADCGDRRPPPRRHRARVNTTSKRLTSRARFPASDGEISALAACANFHPPHRRDIRTFRTFFGNISCQNGDFLTFSVKASSSICRREVIRINVRFKKMRPAEEQSRLRTAGESIQVFYPLILSAVATPLILKFDVLWVGILLGVVLLALHKTWWTCIFGLMNSMAVFAMMLACVVAWIVGNKNEANKASLSTPAPPRVQFAMTIQPSTLRRSFALGQV